MLRTIFSIMIGFLFAYWLGIIYQYYNQIQYHGPNSNTIRKEIYQKNDIDGERCYQFQPVVHICPISYSIKQKIKI